MGRAFSATMPPEPAFYLGTTPIYGDVVLAPMDGYSDLPFRSVCRELGSAISYTEFIHAPDVLQRPERIRLRWQYLPWEQPVVFQIYGSTPQTLLEAALRLQEHGPAAIDINMGCPDSHIVRRGAGAGLLRTPIKVARIFRLLSRRLDVPVTAKIRLGLDDACRNYLLIARIVEENGGALLAVHARTRAQGYKGPVDWDALAEIVQRVHIPVLGNGDVRTPADIERMKAHTGVAGVMIGRAAIRNPWIFARRRREDVAPAEVWAVLQKHLARSLEFYGPERGLILFRKYAAQYLAPWLTDRAVRRALLTAPTPEAFLRLAREIMDSA
jgi:tRNA-dihydrouridine synthase B